MNDRERFPDERSERASGVERGEVCQLHVQPPLRKAHALVDVPLA
jgi:hypothetical protein